MTHFAWAIYKRKGVIVPDYQDLVAKKMAEEDDERSVIQR